MLSKTCVIYEENEMYGKKMLRGFSHMAKEEFKVQLFTKKYEFIRYLTENKPEVIVINENDMFDEIENNYSGKVIKLTEENNQTGIYRYQSLEQIFNLMVSTCDLRKKDKTTNVQVIGIYSPIYAESKTAFALNMARILGESKKTLYLNFEEFSGLEDVLSITSNLTLSDALYYYKHGSQGGTSDIENMIFTYNQIDYIPPVKCAEDISYMSSNEILEFIEMLEKNNDYEVILLDISTAVNQPWKLMEYCNKVYMPVKNDYLSLKKMQSFEKYYNDMGMTNLLKCIEKIKLPEDENISGSDYWDRIVESGMYRFTKKCLAAVCEGARK